MSSASDEREIVGLEDRDQALEAVAAWPCQPLADAAPSATGGDDPLQLVSDAMPVMVVYVDAGQICRFVNRTYTVWMGRPPGELLGRHIRDFLGTDEYALRLPQIARALAGESVLFDARIKHHAGALLDAEIRYIPRRDATGRVEGFYAVATDLSGRKQAEAALRHAENRGRLALEAAEIGIYDYDLQTGALTWDERTRALFGLAADAPVSYEGAFLTGLHPDDRERAQDAVQHAIASRQPFELDYRIGRQTGPVRHVSARGSTIYQGETPVRFIGTVRDVTAAHTAETQARQLAALVEQSSDLIGVTDPDGRLSYMNAAGRAMIGLREGETLPGTLAALFRPEAQARFEAEVRPTLLAGRVWEGDLDLAEVSRGTAVPAHATVFVIRDAKGVPAGYGTVTRDLRDRRRFEQFRAAVIELGDRFQDLDEPAEMAYVAAEIMGRTLGLDRAGYGTMDAAVENIHVERDWTAPGIPTSAGRHGITDHRPLRDTLAAGREVIVTDVNTDPRTASDPEPLLSRGIRAMLNVPVVEHGRTVAMFFLHDGRVRDWRADKLAFIRDVAERTRAAVERKRAEAQRRDSEEQFRVFAQAVPNHVWAATPDGELTWCNERFCAFSGMPSVVLEGQGWIACMHPEDRADVLTRWAEARAAATVLQTEVRLRRTDGVFRWFLVRAEPIRSAGDAVTHWVGTNTDIDDQKRTAAELAALNQSLGRQVAERTRERDQIWQATSDLLCVSAMDGFFVSLNPAWSKTLGWTAAEMMAMPSLDFVHPDDRAATLKAFEGLRHGEPQLTFENRYRHKDGGYRWFSWNAVPRDGLVYATARDITDDKAQADIKAQLESQLRQSQKMEAVGQLTGGIAHDFNNLLTGITGSLEMLQTRLAQGRLAEGGRYIDAAQGAARRAAALTHRLLAFSRRQTLEPKPTRVDALVVGLEDLIRRTVGPAVTIAVENAADPWPILVDANQLENALLNLCINARDAMPEGGRITIRTTNRALDERAAREVGVPAGQYVALSVCDTGLGMTADVAARAFDPFFTTKPMGRGTGLGLSMIYGFVRQSGGQVRLQSEPGRGTTICLYLPRHFGEVEEGEASAQRGPLPKTEAGRTVLVVDDEPTVRMLVVEVLEELGYQALEAADAAAGLDLLRAGPRIDLLVTDVGLPNGMNGRQLADTARLSQPDLKVLFITGFAETALMSGDQFEPGTQVITKPFDLATLAHRIRAMVAG